MSTTYNFSLVSLSILIAIAASFTALDLANRARASEGWVRRGWLSSAAVCMGGGIWSMHFVGMLAFGLPGIQINYNPAITLWSLIVPIAVTAISFFAVSAQGVGLRTLGIGGLFMGLGIGAMHYIGMAAMTMDAELSYDPLWVLLSLAIAIGAATVALWLSAIERHLLWQGVSAVAMGLAIAGMHYAAMAGARFTPLEDAVAVQPSGGLDLLSLAMAVASSTFIILFSGLAASTHDRRLAMLSERETASLRQSEERFRELYSRTPLPLHSLDMEGRLESVSDAWLALVGYRREDVIGRPFTDFMTEACARQMQVNDWPKLFDTGQSYEAEYRLIIRGGVSIDVIASSRLEQTARGPVVLGGLINITERRNAEEALRQVQKMEAVGNLTGGVAHDFNNLLAVVAGNLELLGKRLPSTDARISSLIKNALQATQRGTILVQRMLAFARKQELKPTSVALADLVINMAELLQSSVGSKIAIDVRFPLTLPSAYVDANQLEMVVLNLVINARDALPNGGNIWIEGQLRPSVELPGHEVRDYIGLVVRDDGSGMTPETLARATEPFFTTKGPSKGTGLGLSMAHGLAEQSGGHLMINSTLGQGTTVELWLPVGTGVSAARLPHNGQKEPGAAVIRPLSILVVDDDSLVLDNTTSLLDDLGHSVTQAASGEAALDVLRRNGAFDILVTDQMMPGLTGTELANVIASEWPKMPVLLISGYADLPAGSHRLRVLSKPFTQKSLSDAISETLRRPKTGVVVPLHDRR